MRVLLVDDEPFILQGLSVLIDWTAEGCEIVKKASNGQEALQYLKEHRVDLIIADIKMPVMTGLELLEQIRINEISDAYFVILSGYNDFSFAQQAIRYSCMDYLVKPVQKEALLEVVRRVGKDLAQTAQSAENERRMQEIYLRQNLFALLRGKQSEEQLGYIRRHLYTGDKGIRYIHISMKNIADIEELSDDEIKKMGRLICDHAKEILQDDGSHLLREAFDYEEDYEIGFIYGEYMAQNRGMTTGQFLEAFIQRLNERLLFPTVLLVGKRVEDVEKLSHSYASACVLRSFKGFRQEKPVYYYEEEIQAGEGKVVLCKQSLDSLIKAVEQNDGNGIHISVDELFREMESRGMPKELVSMNTNYLLFQLIHLAVEQDETVDQEEVMQYISENVFDAGIARGSRAHLRRFACEYAEYLIQLRKNVSRGVLQDVEREIREKFAENLTLRDLSKKYFVNSSYLGQIFRKKYGQSFKDYLSAYRINEAAEMLLKTDKKISQIAEEVGYRDTDYFISKFIEQKGCTPSKYRKNAGITE